MLHRDLKPANVLLENGTGRVVLTDFGIARMSGSTTLTETGSFVGSPEYTAPERMSGARTGPESDLWSLGALLCTALSGESPFRRDSLGGVLHAVVVDEIRPPAEAGPILPVVRGLLERDPDRRLDADRAERMLRAFRETGRTPQAAPPGPLPPDRDAPRRRPPVRRGEAGGGTRGASGPAAAHEGCARRGTGGRRHGGSGGVRGGAAPAGPGRRRGRHADEYGAGDTRERVALRVPEPLGPSHASRLLDPAAYHREREISPREGHGSVTGRRPQWIREGLARYG
ncbi:hypothetical protein GCM10023238_18750 [Streptomyces heliomycini]